MILFDVLILNLEFFLAPDIKYKWFLDINCQIVEYRTMMKQEVHESVFVFFPCVCVFGVGLVFYQGVQGVHLGFHELQ